MEFEWRSRFLNSIQGGGKKPWESNAQMVKMAAAYGSLFILPFPVNRLLDREAGFIIILLLLLLFPPPRAFQRALLAGRPDFFGAGGCLSTWHGVGGFTTNSPSSPQVVFTVAKLRSPG